MKNTTLLRTFLGAAALLSCTAFAHAANPFVVGSHWTGIQVSAFGGAPNSATLDVSAPNTGKLVVFGQLIPVSISCTATGVVDLQGLGIPYAGFKVHGSVVPQGGTYRLTGNYLNVNVPGTHNDQGRISLLRSYKTPTGKPTTGGDTSGASLLPPGPCSGIFVNVAGLTGRMVFEHNPPADSTERSNDFSGDIYLQDFHFRVVGVIDPKRNRDGSFNMEMIGEHLWSESGINSLHTAGLLLPAVQTNPTRIVGNYELIGLLRTLDMGRFQVSP